MLNASFSGAGSRRAPASARGDRAAFTASLILLGALALELGGCRARPALPAAPPPAFTRRGDQIVVPAGSALRQKLVLAAPSEESVTAEQVLPGTVEPDPARQDKVLPPLAGKILRLGATLGQRVRAGQVLAVMSSPDLAQALSDDAKARAQVKLTAEARKRAAASLAIGGAAQKDVQQAEADYAAAVSEAARASARLAQVGAIGPVAGGSFALKAPRAGVVTDLAASAGAYWTDLTAPLMTVSDLSTVWVSANVPEGALGDVSVGQAARVSFTAYPGQTVDGRVLFVSPVLDADTRRAKARVALANSNGRLKPNMFATVTLSSPQRRAMTVPTTALVFNDSQTQVFVEVAPWTFQARTVQTGVERDGRTVVAGDLRPGQRIVARGGVLLND